MFAMYAPSPTDTWQLATTNVLWESDTGDSCLTPPDLPVRIRFGEPVSLREFYGEVKVGWAS